MNRERVQAAIDAIKANPGNWQQDDWHSECGTKHCIAGWMQILSGNEPDVETVRRDAREWADLSRAEAGYLFAPSRTVEDFDLFVACDGYDRDGYNRDGYNRDGYNRDGYDRDGYDRAGYDRDGYNRDGYDRDNRRKA